VWQNYAFISTKNLTQGLRVFVAALNVLVPSGSKNARLFISHVANFSRKNDGI